MDKACTFPIHTQHISARLNMVDNTHETIKHSACRSNNIRAVFHCLVREHGVWCLVNKNACLKAARNPHCIVLFENFPVQRLYCHDNSNKQVVNGENGRILFEKVH